MEPGDPVIGPHPSHLGERVEVEFIGFVTIQRGLNSLGGPPPPVRMARIRYAGRTYDVAPELVEPGEPSEPGG